MTVHSNVQNESRLSRPKSGFGSYELPAQNSLGVQQPTVYAERLKTLREKI